MATTLFSMYFDNACFQDLSNAKGRAQRQINGMFRMIGMPLQKEKRVDLGGSNDFMGLTHHMSQAISKNEITFAPKHLLVQKAQAALLSRIKEQICTAAQQASCVAA